MSPEEDISTLYARDLAPTEDEKNFCLLADENRRLVKKKNHRLAEENRAMRNSLTDISKNGKNADPLFFHVIAKAAERKKGGKYTRSGKNFHGSSGAE